MIFLAAAAGVVLATPAPEGQQFVELGKITLPRDFELETDILSRGEYLLVLDEDGLTLVYKTMHKGHEVEGTMSLPTEETEAGDEAVQPKVEIVVVGEAGADHVLITVHKGRKIYKALLKCVVEGPNAVLSKEALTRIDPQVTVEVKVLEESIRLMDRFTGRIWPDWTEYKDLEFRLNFPNRAIVVVTAKTRMPSVFQRMPFDMPDGKHIYINRSAEIPGRINALMTCHGQGDFAGVNMWLMGEVDNGKPSEGGTMIMTQAKAGGVPKIEGQPHPEDPKVLKAAEDEMRFSRMLVYVHECFHVMQARRHLEADIKGLAKPMGRWDPDFVATLNFSLYSELEGEALEKAVGEKDTARALEYFKDFFVARGLKLKEMTEGTVAIDVGRTTTEGTATYSNLRMAMLVRESGLDRKAAGKADPVSAGYEQTGNYIKKETGTAMAELKGESLDVTRKYYIYGGYWCFALDRLFPAWKSGVFENDRTLDDVTAELLKMTDAEKAVVAGRLEADFEYDMIRARHAAAIKERDDALAAVHDAKGKHYVIDVAKAGPGFDIFPRKLILYKRSQIYPLGLEKIVFGSLRLTSKETPMMMEKRKIQWTDTEAKTGEKGYELKFKSREGDVYKDISLTTRGFSMTAGTVRLIEAGDTVTISILD